MAYGLRVWDASGNLVFDTTTAKGGVVVGYFTYSTGTTLSYSGFAGRTMQVLPASGVEFDSNDIGVTISTASGYPVVTVATRTNARSFILAVF